MARAPRDTRGPCTSKQTHVAIHRLTNHLGPHHKLLEGACNANSNAAVTKDQTCSLCNIVHAYDTTLCGAHEAAVRGEPDGEDLGVLRGGVGPAAALSIVQPVGVGL